MSKYHVSPIRQFFISLLTQKYTISQNLDLSAHNILTYYIFSQLLPHTHTHTSEYFHPDNMINTSYKGCKHLYSDVNLRPSTFTSTKLNKNNFLTFPFWLYTLCLVSLFTVVVLSAVGAGKPMVCWSH